MTTRYEKIDSTTIKKVYEAEERYSLEEIKMMILTCDEDISRAEANKTEWLNLLNEMKKVGIETEARK